MDNLRFQHIETKFSLVSVQQVKDFRFDLAHQQGHALLGEFNKEYNPKIGLTLAISPSDPRKDKPFYLEPDINLEECAGHGANAHWLIYDAGGTFNRNAKLYSAYSYFTTFLLSFLIVSNSLRFLEPDINLEGAGHGANPHS